MPDEPNPAAERFHRFTSTTVHHLREPVRMLSVYSEMLRSQGANQPGAEPVKSLDFIHKAALQMQKLLHGLAEFAYATDPAPRALRMVQLTLALRQVLLRLSAEIKAADAKISYTGLPEVWGDSDRLELVFQHLIVNALSYRGECPPVIEVSARQDGGNWIVRVADNGPGVAPEFREKIFEPYSRLHGRALPGNGLGLAVCREIIEGLGGRIWVEDVPSSAGAVFCFTLPGRGDVV